MIQIKQLLERYLSSDEDAIAFVYCWLLYCHAIDDIIDGDKTDSEHIIKTFQFSTTLHTSNFFLKNWATLNPIIDVAFNSYADSVKLEKGVKWERNYADVLRQVANEVIVAVVGIVAGYDKKREISLELRQLSYLEHHDLTGKPI